MTLRFWLRAPGYYKEHRVHSPPGVQRAALRLLLEHGGPTSSVLDLGSGSGAMIARLEDAGFTDLHAVARDFQLVGDPGDGTPDHPEALLLDLKSDFSEQLDGPFSVIISSELIEHLPSPRHFLSQVHRLLEAGGHLVLTTPNVSNWIGRLRFLFFGELRWFDELRAPRLNHISPITDAQMRLMLTQSRFDLIASTAAGSFLSPLGVVLTAPVSLPFLVLGGRRAWGDCNIYVARKTAGP